MKVLIIGPGALGCLLASKLSSRNEVWFLDHDPARAAFLDRSGLIMEEGGAQTNHSVHATTEAELVGSSDLALLCVKALKVEEALIRAQPALRKTKLFLALQNGIQHLEVLPKLCRSFDWGLATTTQAATLAGPGHVLHRGAGPTWIGPPPGEVGGGRICRPASARALQWTAEVLSEAGIASGVVTDILPRLWDKLLINLGINALTAINDCQNGALLDDPILAGIMAEAVTEGARVAERLGIKIVSSPVAAAREVCLATSANFSSMLQDLRAGRLTEIEAINGALVKIAIDLGVRVPVNAELVRKVHELERNYHVFC